MRLKAAERQASKLVDGDTCPRPTTGLLRRREEGRRRPALGAASEKDAKLAQKLDQLQPFVAVFPQGCTGQGQRESSGPT
jgi:hypothetical protein